MKLYFDWRTEKREFEVRYWVLLFKSRFKLFLVKLKSKWSGPFKVTQVFLFGAVKLENSDGKLFKVNGHHIKQ